MPSTHERLTSVDSLRGIAILMVLAVHVSGLVTPASEWLSQITRMGPRGVQLFYVVSAFSLFLSFQRRRTYAGFSYRSYFIRRFARIAPMFWFAMATYLLVFGMAPNYWAPNGITPSTVALTASFLNGWSPTKINSIIPGGWSVAIEMTFYLVLPVCFVLVRTLKAAVIATCLCLIARYWLCTWEMESIMGSFPDSQQYLPLAFSWEFWLPAQLPVFMLGIVLFFLREKMTAMQPGVGIFWLGAALALLTASSYLHADRFISSHVVAGLGFVLLALALFDPEARFLDNSVLRKIGEVSFSIYLLHHLVVHYTGGTIVRALSSLGLGTSGDMPYAIAYVAITAMSTALAMVTYRLIEEPSIALGSRLSERLATAAPLPPGRPDTAK
ncbi:MAG: hypothetical protein CL858_13525 [Cupriavidus sp.]|nr:hypothetical protein [Cupriavidus sp.]